MPVEFLADDKVSAYGSFPAAVSRAQLAEYFHLAADTDVLGARRGDHNRLGFALQLCTVRFLGTFLADPIDVPSEVVDYLAVQLEIDEPSVLKLYRDSETRWDHQAEIRHRFGYVSFGDGVEHYRFLRWLLGRSWVTNERPTLLFDHATAYLLDHQVLLPGVTVLARLVASALDRSRQRLWRSLTNRADPAAVARLEQLLVVPAGERQSAFDRLRTAPSRPSSAGLVGAIERLEEIRGLGAHSVDLSDLPPATVRQLARHASGAKAQTVRRMTEARRTATLVAFAHTLAVDAADDVLDVFDTLLGELRLKAEHQARQARLRTISEFDRAAVDLRAVASVVLAAMDDPSIDVRQAVVARVPRERLEAAIGTVSDLAREPGDRYQTELLDRYSTIRRFLPQLLDAVSFDGTPGARPVLDAIECLRKAESGPRRRTLGPDAPTSFLSNGWRPHVERDDGSIDRRAYTMVTLEALREGLRRHDVFISPSHRWADPRRHLIDQADWPHHRTEICAALGHDQHPERELAALAERLDTSYRRVANDLDSLPGLAIADAGLTVSPLEAVDEPPSLIKLRTAVEGLLPQVELPDVILEVDHWTGFSSEFSHASGANTRLDGLPTSVCAVLVAQACNIGYRPLTSTANSSLTEERLNFVASNYFRAETLAAANARLVDYHDTLPLAEAWGGGDVASVDGLRFVVPLRTTNAGFNRRYFPARGVTWLNYMTDHFSGFHQLVVPGTLRDSLYTLEGLLEHQTTVEPKEVMTDTAGASDAVFGLFWLLGYQFSPRLADIGHARFWRIDPTADYGPLNPIAKHRIDTDLIADNWDDLLRIAGSLQRGNVRASDLLRFLNGPSTSTGRALRDLGRIIRTLYQLAYVEDPDYQRRIHTQLNHHESRHALARAIFHGDKGQLRQRYREGQEDQLSALGLVVNCVTLWNTVYTQHALDHLVRTGHLIDPLDVERLSPLARDHINFRGRYTINPSNRPSRLRPLSSSS